MSDVMLCNILRMPNVFWGDPLTLTQIQSRAREAADELERRAAEIERLRADLDRLRKSEAENVTLHKRPVAFRIPDHNGWIILQNEEAAQIEADHRNVDYQGLYVRDGAIRKDKRGTP